MWGEFLRCQRLAVLRCACVVKGDPVFDSVVAETSSGAGGEQRFVGVVTAFL
jgi:hypothetical protein